MTEISDSGAGNSYVSHLQNWSIAHLGSQDSATPGPLRKDDDRTEDRIQHAKGTSARPWRLGIWLSGAAMLLSLLGDSAAMDIEFWRTWITEFQKAGYQGLSANYPPMLLHWLRLVAWAFNAAELTPQSSILIKTVVTFPALICQLVFVDLVGRLLAQKGEQPLRTWLFWLTVFNPALLADGPVWGQVDLLPIVPAYFAIVAANERSSAVWSLPWFALSLLCKMQAIVVVPVLAGLALRHWRQHLRGAPLAIVIFAIGFLPFELAGADVIDAMRRGYWANVGLYPFSTVYAANLWCLVGGMSLQPDHVSLVHSDWLPHWLVHSATPSKVGLLLFCVTSLVVLVSGFRDSTRRNALGLAVVSATSFFAFCSGMHERYLVSAVAFAALWGCEARNCRYWYAVLTCLLYANISFVLDFWGVRLMRLLSALVVLTFMGMAFQVLFKTDWLERAFVYLNARAEMHRLAPYLSFTLFWLTLTAALMVWQIHHPAVPVQSALSLTLVVPG